MNFYAPNSAVVNGTSTPIWLQGFASTTGSLNAAADANYIRSGVAAVEASATIVADCTYIHKPDADAPSVSGLFGVATKTHALAADVGGAVNIQAFVLRDAFATAAIDLSADIVAIVADEIGAATANATAEVTPVGTRVQPQGASAPTGTASIPAVTALARRETTIDIDVSAAVYANPNVNGVSTETSAVTGSANIALSNSLVLNTKTQAAGSLPVLGTASSIPAGTVTQTAQALPTSVAVVLVAEPFIENIALTFATGSGAMTAIPNRTTQSSAGMSSSSFASAQALQKYSAEPITLSGTFEVTAQSNQTFRPTLNFHATLASASAGVIVKVGVASIDADVVIPDPDSVRTTFATCDVQVATSVSAAGTRVKSGAATSSCVAGLTALGTRSVFPDSTLATEASIIAEATRVAIGSSDAAVTCEVVDLGAFRTTFGAGDYVGTMTLFVDSVANPASVDPPERTFVKPFAQFDFQKIEQEFVFRRAA